MKFVIIVASILACALAATVTPRQWNCSISVTIIYPPPDPQMYEEVDHVVALINGKDRYRRTVSDTHPGTATIYERTDVKNRAGKCQRMIKTDEDCSVDYIDCDKIAFPVFKPYFYTSKKIVECPFTKEMNCMKYSKSEFSSIILNKDGFLILSEDDIEYQYHGEADPSVFGIDGCSGEEMPIPKNPCGAHY